MTFNVRRRPYHSCSLAPQNVACRESRGNQYGSILDMNAIQSTSNFIPLYHSLGSGEHYIKWNSSPDIVWVIKSRRMRWAEHVARIGERRVAHKVLVGKPEGKRPLGRHRPRWEDNIEVYLKQPRFEGLHWIDVAQHSNR